MRDDLLHCRLPPDSKLRVEWAVAQYGAGASPVREALNRLAAEGLLDRRDQRGFFVMPITLEELEELTRTRCWLEERAFRESMTHRTAGWEEGVVIALHRLSRVPRRAENGTPNPEWETRHRAFHRSLISACRSDILIGFCEQLADQAYRYRQVAREAGSVPRDESAEHNDIATKAINGDANGAVEALLHHYRLTSELCGIGLRT
ncbi:GntR family transcriptional regulator [Acidisoma cellulosilytica]|uniref:GntR family transcriptional regulator n=2 Tax=Acidisoma cellulosilyticum TaxID=2802395 RepID=A0A964E4P7_9PROT|nr:GntR family transcriptional regulator [Acidisoma cellulosilyticum]